MTPKIRIGEADLDFVNAFTKESLEMFNLLGRSRPCEHPETATTRNYGLLRKVCRVCGMVQIEALPGADKAPEQTDNQALAAS